MAQPCTYHRLCVRGPAAGAHAVHRGWMPTWFEIAALLGWLLLCGLLLVVYIDLRSYLQDITATGAQTRLCVDDVKDSVDNLVSQQLQVCAGVHAASGVVLAEPAPPACRRRL